MLKIIFSAIAELLYHSCIKDNVQLKRFKKQRLPRGKPLFWKAARVAGSGNIVALTTSHQLLPCFKADK
jgi:hypothetical protein